MSAVDIKKRRVLTKGMMSNLLQSYLKHRPLVQKTVMTAFAAYVILAATAGLRPKKKNVNRNLGGNQQGSDPKRTTSSRSRRRGGPRVEVDALFFERLNKILLIVIPSWRSKTASLLVIHSAFLVFRTLLSLVS